ncbi:MAG TPA: Crp/Fnr family transcriptional regulator [Calditrichia bacterium]|nr:Crp/Fnr family transcriptional regulator [Calditrichia bacterium]
MTNPLPSDPYLALSAALQRWAELPQPQWLVVREGFRRRKAVARELVVFPGSQSHDLLFVSRGLLRFFYLDEGGRETNKAFVAENEFAAPLASAVLQQPVYYGVEALEETEYLSMPLGEFRALYHRHPVFERLGRCLAEMLLVRKERRMRSMLEQTATERYRTFLAENPLLAERIPQYHLASYLGITEVSLSRLKKAL